MLAFHKEILESVTVSLKVDAVLYDFFGKKKGKKYKVLKGTCSLERLKSFSSRLQDDIDEITNDRCGPSACDQFTAADSTTKLIDVKSHVDTLIAVTTTQAITLKKTWEYFESHIEEYLPGMPKVESASFKPRFSAHVGEYYGLE